MESSNRAADASRRSGGGRGGSNARNSGRASGVSPSRVDPSDMSKTIADQLASLHYECANCLEVIRHEQPTWGCLGCFRVFHLGCIKKWAMQGESGEGRSFRCPHCQAPQKPVSRYRCFCLKQVDPKYDPLLACPHSCGQTCGRRRGDACPHPCPNQCHPGPCPECPAFAPSKRCPCGKTAYTYRCGRPDPKTVCDNVCGKKLNCGKHSCTLTCHNGPCEPCAVVQPTPCTCGKVVRDLPCGSTTFSCATLCNKVQRCGEHHCDVVCHSGGCPPCNRDPSVVHSCPCGKKPLVEARIKCTDPIPSCGAICGKVLSCSRHCCIQVCHDSPCLPCESKSSLHCPCGSTMAKVYCRDIDSFKCQKKCKTKLSCGKHECEEICCPSRNQPTTAAHICKRLCGKKLSCGHACQELCHRGACPSCPNIITAPLYCRCGVEMIMPPLPCGTQPPTCRLPCNIPRPCGHPTGDHPCHYGDCPPCSKPVTRMCAGNHKELGNVLCSAESVCCSDVCGKALACGHVCQRPCHVGPCVDAANNKPCTQPCGKSLACGHTCTSKCHPEGTPCGKCAAAVELQCDCGVRSVRCNCAEYLKRLRDHRNSSKCDQSLVLECTDDCIYEQRLRVLKGLSQSKSDPSGGKVIYSVRLWFAAEKSLDVVKAIEERLCEFMRSGDQSVMLPPMQKEKRAIVHELAHFFHIQTESHDVEPNRTVYLTKTVRSEVPNPLLSVASRNPQHNPMVYVESVLPRTDDMQKRTIVFEGDRLSAVDVSRYLSCVAGDYVLIEPTDEQLQEPRTMRSVGGGERVPMETFYAIFLPYRAKAAFSILKQRGCPFLYRLIGFPYPPKQFAWEPSRPAAPTSSSTATRTQAVSALAPVATHHVDPLAEAQSSSGAAPPAQRTQGGQRSSWAALVQQRPNAKTRKEQQTQSVDVTNQFSALRK